MQEKSGTYNNLVARIKNDDENAVEQLFRQYYKDLVHFAFRYVNQTDIGEDIVHDVFVRMWKNRQDIDFNINIKTYLFNSVRNHCFNYLKKSKMEATYKLETIVIEYNFDTPESQFLENETQCFIQEAIGELPPKCREIFCMNRFDNLTYYETATVLGISVKTVETQMSRALKFLRSRLAFLFNSK